MMMTLENSASSDGDGRYDGRDDDDDHAVG